MLPVASANSGITIAEQANLLQIFIPYANKPSNLTRWDFGPCSSIHISNNQYCVLQMKPGEDGRTRKALEGVGWVGVTGKIERACKWRLKWKVPADFVESEMRGWRGEPNYDKRLANDNERHYATLGALLFRVDFKHLLLPGRVGGTGWRGEWNYNGAVAGKKIHEGQLGFMKLWACMRRV